MIDFYLISCLCIQFLHNLCCAELIVDLSVLIRRRTSYSGRSTSIFAQLSTNTSFTIEDNTTIVVFLRICLELCQYRRNKYRIVLSSRYCMQINLVGGASSKLQLFFKSCIFYSLDVVIIYCLRHKNIRLDLGENLTIRLMMQSQHSLYCGHRTMETDRGSARTRFGMQNTNA